MKIWISNENLARMKQLSKVEPLEVNCYKKDCIIGGIEINIDDSNVSIFTEILMDCYLDKPMMLLKLFGAMATRALK